MTNSHTTRRAVAYCLMDSRESDTDDTAGVSHCPLRLYTLAGKEIETIVPISIYHHWEMLEDYLVELLARYFDLDTFGCELMLISEDTMSPLSDHPQGALGKQAASTGHLHKFHPKSKFARRI